MKDFVIDGRRVSFERGASADEFRILVDGVAVPMTLTDIETSIGNLGSRTRELGPSRRVSWIPSRGCPVDTEVRVTGAQKARFGFPLQIEHVYNTAVWRYHSASLEFADDYSSVEVRWEYSVDTST